MSFPALHLLNGRYEPLPLVLSAHRRGVKWELVLDTRTAEGRRLHRPMRGGEEYALEARSMALLQLGQRT